MSKDTWITNDNPNLSWQPFSLGFWLKLAPPMTSHCTRLCGLFKGGKRSTPAAHGATFENSSSVSVLKSLRTTHLVMWISGIHLKIVRFKGKNYEKPLDLAANPCASERQPHIFFRRDTNSWKNIYSLQYKHSSVAMCWPSSVMVELLKALLWSPEVPSHFHVKCCDRICGVASRFPSALPASASLLIECNTSARARFYPNN